MSACVCVLCEFVCVCVCERTSVWMVVIDCFRACVRVWLCVFMLCEFVWLSLCVCTCCAGHHRMTRIVTHSLASVAAKINRKRRPLCFELFGYDFMVDQDFNVRHSPVPARVCVCEPACAPVSFTARAPLLFDCYLRVFVLPLPTADVVY